MTVLRTSVNPRAPQFWANAAGMEALLADIAAKAERVLAGGVEKARSRGVDWIYSYLKSFYVDDTRAFGVNNTILANASMPHVLWDLQGMQALDLPPEEEGVHHTPTYEDLKLVTPGTQSVEEYDQTIQDLVNYLVYMGEPIKLERSKIGIWVMLYLVIFAVVAYLLKKEYWRDIH